MIASGLVSALTATALGPAAPVTSCQSLKEASATQAGTAKTAGNAYPVATGRKKP